MAGSALKRLMHEYKQLTLQPPEGIIAGPKDEDNFFEWEAYIRGPEGSVYENGVFPAIITFPTDYPMSPPKMRFTGDMFHPNVYSNGSVCISILHNPGKSLISLKVKLHGFFRTQIFNSTKLIGFCFLRFFVQNFATSSKIRNFKRQTFENFQFFSKHNKGSWEYKRGHTDIIIAARPRKFKKNWIFSFPVNILLKVFTQGHFQFIYPNSGVNGVRGPYVYPKVFRNPIRLERLCFAHWLIGRMFIETSLCLVFRIWILFKTYILTSSECLVSFLNGQKLLFFESFGRHF